MDCGIDENLIDWDQSYTLSFYCKRETKLVNLIYNLNSFTEGLPPIVIGGGGGGGLGFLKGTLSHLPPSMVPSGGRPQFYLA